MSREEVLGRIRRSLNRKGALPEGVAQGLARRTARSAPHILPAIAEELLDRFVNKVEAVAGTTVACKRGAGISEAVVEFLQSRRLPLRIVVSDDDLLRAVAWSNRLDVSTGLPDPSDLTSVTAAFGAVAETGSVVMISERQTPTSLNLLPENHIVAVPNQRVFKHQEEVWQALRERPGGMPRTVNFITGPSRTGDVEQVLQLGAHGPRQLHVLMVDDASPDPST
jgi:L-lactate dehydrogenase complex protein LldG